MIVEFDAHLVEQAVLVSAGDRPDFRADRESAYASLEPEARERAFAGVHAQWFDRLEIGAVVLDSLGEQPSVARGVARGFVGLAERLSDEGAELFVVPGSGSSAPDQRRLVLRMRSETIVDPARARLLLRRELLHVADMIDPEFAYQPSLPLSSGGPSEDRLTAARYGAAWSATIVGRLVGMGRLPSDALAEAAEQFRRAFPMLGPSDGTFERLAACRPTHGDLVAFARDPRETKDGRSSGAPGSRCVACRMPAYRFVEVDDTTATRMARDIAGWQPGNLVCLQCADLYRVGGAGGDRRAVRGATLR